jgi:hypothetical protein
VKFFVEKYIVGTIRELSIFKEGQVTTYPYKNKKQAKIVKYREVFDEKWRKECN